MNQRKLAASHGNNTTTGDIADKLHVEILAYASVLCSLTTVLTGIQRVTTSVIN